MRRTTTVCLLVAAMLGATAAVPANAQSAPAAGQAEHRRVTAAGALFGPQASADALQLLGVAAQPTGSDDPTLSSGSPVVPANLPVEFGGNAQGPDVQTPVKATVPGPPSATPGPSTVTVAPGDTNGFAMVEDSRPRQEGVYATEATPGTSRLPAGDVVPRAPSFGPAQPSSGVAVATSAGPVVCPVDGKTWFTDTWSAARSSGQHQATDMFAAIGTPVVAVADAVLTKVDRTDSSGPRGEGDLGGITVSYVTSHGDRWYNAHLSAIEPDLAAGDRVAAGQPIGRVGRSGNAKTTPAHLHVSWHPGAGDPAPNYAILRAACG